ncbi:lysozyme [Atlantibacter sp. RC6]|uniref:lysozyme n=1 Tax=Atlantibacter sp. RC6 TaxID=2587036 RepID=UPI00160569F4|nr:lysozyme [Atlantibacter sp. RC6]MBB3322499.1 GH24 family phage-related lysozyme (muramidase) [Atlantibacter sp. RC6]
MKIIKASVGIRGINNNSDVRTVAQWLFKKGFYNLDCHSINIGNVARAIVVYQRSLLLNADGIILPGKHIEKLLSGAEQGAIRYKGFDNTSNRYDARDMQPSQQCIKLMKSYETYQRYPYNDQTSRRVNGWCPGATIGYGHLLSRSEFTHYAGGLSEPDASRFFNNQLIEYIKPVQNYVKTKLTQGEFDALVMLTYNIGPRNDDKKSGFYHSEVLKIINGESSDELEKAWRAYSISQGHIMHGLVNRRTSELNVFNNNGYVKI